MSLRRKRSSFSLLVGASILALAVPQVALAQSQPQPQPQPTDDTAAAKDDTPPAGEASSIVITGIRGSLRQSMDIKKNAIGVVDAISAEEMGKFPDTNLA